MTSGQIPLTRLVAEFVALADVASISDRALDFAERALADTVGVAIAASNDDSQRALWRALTGTLPSGPASVFTRPVRTSPRDAALINGAAAHALDYDDVTDELIAHVSAVIYPAALAVAEQQDTSGRELLAAYCVGYQVDCAVAAGMPVAQHYAKGWHTTATIGIFGAVAAVARLLGLSAGQVEHALGLAVSLAGGSRGNFGSMTKPLHAGLAASHAVMACLLAAADFTAAAAQLESPLGYYALFGDSDGDLARASETLHSGWLLERGELDVKRYPCCYYTHRIADAALDIFPKISVAEVDEVTVTVQPGGLAPLIHHRPSDGLQGKFSAEYVVAACLLDGRLGFRSFTDEAVNRDQAQSMLRRVKVAEADRAPFGPAGWERGYAVLTVRTATGEEIVHRVDVPSGHATAPISEAGLAEKFADCLAFGGRAAESTALYAALRHARDAASVRDLLPRPAAPRQAGR